MTDAYIEFLRAKVQMAPSYGFEVHPSEVNPKLKPHQVAIVVWAVAGGRRAIFAAFGLGKSVIQLEVVRLTRARAGGMGLIVVPLGVRQEFIRDAAMLGIRVKFVRTIEECDDPEGIYLTNYETVRDGKLDPRQFSVASLDEAACLRGFGGTKTFREFMALFAGDDRRSMHERVRSQGVRYRFVATATPSPNEYVELLAYCAFLGVMDVGQAKTRFFKRNSEKADQLTIHPHKEREFWLWMASWALFVQRPSDLGFSDEGYELPPIDVRWHEVEADHSHAGHEAYGQARMFKAEAIGVVEAAREKRDSLDARLAKLMELRAEDPGAHRILWHDLEDERRALEKAIPGLVTVYGSQALDEREAAVASFSDGGIQELASKPVLLGSGCNLQRHCHWAIFMGVGFKFADLIQAIHRLQRFLQTKPVRVDFIHTTAERSVRRLIERKWQQHIKQMETMTQIIREFGLSKAAMASNLTRALGVKERIEVRGRSFVIANNDCVDETRRMESNSVGLVLTSIPFSTQYEYSPNYADFGHTDSNSHFFEQMDFLTPELLRVLHPGRLAAIHVKDRIVPGGMTGLGFQTVYPFHADTIRHFQKHGFAYMGMKTIVTDVVRENNQTYRLGWSEQCKDASKMGVGMPEYLLIFRKPPSDNSNSYADTPVVKLKPFSVDEAGNMIPFDREKPMVPGTGYSRARWQVDAHGFTRSSGNRLLTAEELQSLPHDAIFQIFKDHSLRQVYDFEQHVKIGEALEVSGKLPVTFMLLQPQSWSDEVWSDITRMLTLNGAQSAKGKEMHLCLARGSLVLTREGYIPIEDVAPGDEVLTHRGRWRKVLASRMTGEGRDVVDLRAQGVAGLRLTPDHKVWARIADGARAVDAAASAEPGWIQADDAVGNYINLKLPPVEESPLTATECWLVGRWLADGHVGARGDFWVSIGPAKIAEFERAAGLHAGTRSEGTATQIRLKGLSDAITTVLKRCGRRASGKRVPADLLGLEGERATAVLAGYLSGDGHYLESRKRWQASSASRALLLGIAMLVQRVHGTIASLAPGRPAGEAVIQGRHVATQQEWVLSFDDGTAQSRKRPFLLDDGAWKRVRSADPAGTSEVWCLKVEDDESFTAEGCIVKNCPMQFDIADRAITQWSMKGEEVYDPFGGLMTVPFRAIKLGRRGRAAELNPGYFLDGAAYCRAAEEEMATPTLFDFAEAEAA